MKKIAIEDLIVHVVLSLFEYGSKRAVELGFCNSLMNYLYWGNAVYKKMNKQRRVAFMRKFANSMLD